MLQVIRGLYRRVRSYVLRKLFKVPVAGEKIEAGQPIYIDADRFIRVLSPTDPGKVMGIALEQGGQNEPVKVVKSGNISGQMPEGSVYLHLDAGAPTTKRGELLGYAAVDIQRGKSLEIEHEDEDGRLWLRPIVLKAAYDDTASPDAILDEAVVAAGRVYGIATEAAAAGEPVIGVKR